MDDNTIRVATGPGLVLLCVGPTAAFTVERKWTIHGLRVDGVKVAITDMLR